MTSVAPAPPAAVALFADLFDDAATFPPASSPVDEALAAHHTARRGGFRWMLGRFVVALRDVGQLASSGEAAGQLRLSVLVDGEDTIRPSASLRVDSIEAVLADADVAARARSMRRLADDVGAADAYLEIPWAEFPQERYDDALAVLASERIGCKIRCGGATPAAVPPPAVVASVLAACRDHAVPLKATAGLHHPFRHPDADLGVQAHGFVNLLVAAALAARGASEPDLAQATGEEEASAFELGSRELRWRGTTLSRDELAAGRRLLRAIGTCSFREPVEDLVALGWLPVP